MKKDFADVRAYTMDMANEIVADEKEMFVAIIRRAIEADIDRMNDDRWKRFARSPDLTKWENWKRGDVKKRITDAFHRVSGDRESIRRILFGPKATDIVAMTAKRVIRTAAAGAAGYVAALPLAGGNPWIAGVMALGAIGAEKAGRETIKKATGSNFDIIAWIINLLLKIFKKGGE